MPSWGSWWGWPSCPSSGRSLVPPSTGQGQAGVVLAGFQRVHGLAAHVQRGGQAQDQMVAHRTAVVLDQVQVGGRDPGLARHVRLPPRQRQAAFADAGSRQDAVSGALLHDTIKPRGGAGCKPQRYLRDFDLFYYC